MLLYRTCAFAQGDMAGFTRQSGNTVAIAAVLAVGVLLVSTAARGWFVWKHRHRR